MKNEVIVGEEAELYKKEIEVTDINLLLVDEIKDWMEVTVKTRYSSKEAKAKIIQVNSNGKVNSDGIVNPNGKVNLDGIVNPNGKVNSNGIVNSDTIANNSIDENASNTNMELKEEMKTIIKVVFDEPQKAITPGQSAVFYVEDIVLGGGKIL